MGMFFGNYDRPGPGVRKDEPKKKAVPRFFTILQRKFFDLVKLNLLFCLPVVVVAALIFAFSMIYNNILFDLIPIAFLFPFIGGLTYVTRNYVREEHAFVFWDFKDAVKNNWKPLLIDGFIVYAVAVILSVSIPYYFQVAPKGLLTSVAACACILIGLLFLFSQYYTPLMIVTFDLKLTQILKNSLIFAILGLWRNLLVTLLIGIIALFTFVAFYIEMPLLIIIFFCLLIFLLFSYCSFLINFAAYPLIDKLMVQPYKKQQENNGSGEEDDESDSDTEEDSDFIDRT
jgi:uncharacterized membrane protein YesL